MEQILELITFERGAIIIGGIWAVFHLIRQMKLDDTVAKERDKRWAEERELHHRTMQYWDAKINEITNPLKNEE